MASTLRKIADKLEGKDKEQHNNPHSTNYGPHSSAAANKLDPSVDSDLDGRNDHSRVGGGYGHTGNTHSHTTAGGVGAPGYQTGGVGQPHTATTGPHNSNLANKLDPRVDSDQSQHAGGYGTHQTTTSHTTTHSAGVNPVGGTHTHAANNGPHDSNVANKLDPRVNTDATTHGGAYGNTHTTGAGYGTGHTGTTGYAGANTVGGNTHSSNTGTAPHSNNLLNKLDPRVDADAHARNDPSLHTGGYSQTQHSHTSGPTHGTHTGAQGYTGTNVAHDDPRSTNTGPHSSNLLNKLDPRVDSDRDGRNDPTSKTGGYGQTQTGSGVGRY